jgi:hypothetical protein
VSKGQSIGGGFPGFSSILYISSMSLHRAKVGFYGEDVRQMHTKSEHESRALRGFFLNSQIVSRLCQKSFHLNFICTNTKRVVYIVCLATPAECNAC